MLNLFCPAKSKRYGETRQDDCFSVVCVFNHGVYLWIVYRTITVLVCGRRDGATMARALGRNQSAGADYMAMPEL